VTLVAGTVTVTTSACTSSSLVFITITTSSIHTGYGYVSSVTNGSFTITSSNSLDTSSYNYLIIG
jgi:hypothetical protein